MDRADRRALTFLVCLVAAATAMLLVAVARAGIAPVIACTLCHTGP